MKRIISTNLRDYKKDFGTSELEKKIEIMKKQLNKELGCLYAFIDVKREFVPNGVLYMGQSQAVKNRMVFYRKQKSELLEKLQILIGKKRILLPFPLPIAELTARFFEILPNPLLTRDQLRLLKYHNVSSGKYKTNSDIGIPSVKLFDQEVKKYCYMWREGGQFSTEKYLLNKDLENEPKN